MNQSNKIVNNILGTQTKKCTIKFKQGDKPDYYFDKKQLNIGIKIEMEHTDNPNIAKQIAKAHLIENKNYYIALAKIEKRF